MIICSCNRISDKSIRAAVRACLERDPNAMLTPGLIYRELGMRAECGTCLTLAIETIINEIDHPSHQGAQVIHLSKLQAKLSKKRKNNQPTTARQNSRTA